MIYSYRHKPELGRVVPVEYKNNRIQGYMTEYCWQNLSMLSGLDIIPITSRSLDLYSRIKFPVGIQSKIHTALVCNGAIRQINGIVDEVWYHESKRMAMETKAVLNRIEHSLRRYSSIFRVYRVEDFMLYAACDTPGHHEAVKRGCKYHEYNLDIQENGRKLYIIPKVFSKGASMQRLLRLSRNPQDTILAAGDSILDASFLKLADIAYIPETMERNYRQKNRRVVKGILSDGICRALESQA